MPRISVVLTIAIILSAIFCLRPSPAAAEPITTGNTTAGSSASDLPEVKEAETRFSQGDIDGAVKLLKDAAKKYPDQPPANVMVFYWLYTAAQSGDRRAASMIQSALERAVTEAPNDPEAYLLMGRIGVSDGRVTEAGLLFDKASGLLRDYSASQKRKREMQKMLHRGLADIAAAREEYPRQQEELEALLKLDSKDVSALVGLGQCLFRQKKPDAALAELKMAAKVNPALLTPEAIISQWYLASGDKENAKKWMAAAVAAAPRDVSTRIAAAQLAFSNLDFATTQKQALAALQLKPTEVRAKLVLGWVAMFQKDYKAAEDYLESADRQANKPRALAFQISNNLALALVEQKDEAKKAQALKIAQDNFQQYQRNADAWATLGWVMFKQGQNADEAEKLLRYAINDLGNSTPDTLYQFACVLHQRGHDAEAKLWLEQALKSTQPFAYRDEAQTLLKRVKS